MQSVGVPGRRGRVSHRLVVGPEGASKVITLVHTRFYPRVERRDRGRDRAQVLRDQNLERRDFLPDKGSSREHVTWQEAESEGVGVLDNDHVFHMQVEVAPEGRSRCGCTRYESCLHKMHPDMCPLIGMRVNLCGREFDAVEQVRQSRRSTLKA